MHKEEEYKDEQGLVFASRNKSNAWGKSGISVVSTNYRYADKNNSNEMDLKRGFWQAVRDGAGPVWNERPVLSGETEKAGSQGGEGKAGGRGQGTGQGTPSSRG